VTAPLGYIIYEGPSRIDGAPIVVIVNRIDDGSANEKTGALAQTFIIRSDVSPVDALRTGADAGVCGDCPHRPILARETGAAPCYVNVGRSVQAVWGAYKRGRYERAPLPVVAEALRGKKLRLGTYGDPWAAPLRVWRAIMPFVAGHTGYSHQWQNPRFRPVAWTSLVMASADSFEEAQLAHAKGMRTFRVTLGTDKRAGEITCPASAEGGRKTTCANCLLCAGTTKRAPNILIRDHAIGWQRRAA
jgi:hypothetical protein